MDRNTKKIAQSHAKGFFLNKEGVKSKRVEIINHKRMKKEKGPYQLN